MQTTEIARPSRTPLRDVLAFSGLTYALALAVALAFPDAHINVLFNSLVPVVAVTVLTFTLVRRGGRRELWRSFGLRRSGRRTWGAAFAVPLALCGGAFGTALLVGAGTLKPLHITGSTASNFVVNTAINLVITVLFALSEEIGFRAFMLPRVQQLTGRRRAAVVTGFAHALFHLPLILLATTYDAVGSRWVVAPVVVVTVTAAGVFYAWLRDRSGTAWSPAVGHGVANVTFDLGLVAVASTTAGSLDTVAGESGFATLGVVVVAAVVLLARARVWRSRPAVEPVDAPAHELVDVR
ncbi:hypothetical protein GCM10027446_08590 [Angustibacter peucedani]